MLLSIASSRCSSIRSLIELATPSRFVELSARLMPWLIAATALAFLVSGIQGHLAPDDYQ